MERIIVQIYEIQEPREAECLLELGVDHIGSVILSEEAWNRPPSRTSSAWSRTPRRRAA